MARRKKPDWMGPLKAAYHVHQAYESAQNVRRQYLENSSAFSETLVYLGVAIVAVIIALL